MIQLISPPTSIGLEGFLYGTKAAQVTMGRKGPLLIKLFPFHPEKDNVKQLYIHHPIITTSLESKEILVRAMRLPLTKEKDIQAAIAFQAEPLLPYPSDQSLLAYQIISKAPEYTDLTLLSVRKETLQNHIQTWQNLQIEPEKIACIPSAICQFASYYLSTDKTYLIVHLQRQGICSVLVKEGKLLASFGQSDGLELLLKAQAEENLPFLPENKEEWQTAAEQINALSLALRRLQKEIAKMTFALAKEVQSEKIDGIVVTGEAAEYEGLNEILVNQLPFPLLSCEPHCQYSSRELLSYAVPIGLALNALPNSSLPIDFRQEEMSFPYPWRRLLTPIVLYFLLVTLLSFAFYFFSQQYLRYQEDHLRQTFVDLLSGMHRTYEQFESTFQTKTSKPHENSTDYISPITQLNQDDLIERLSFLQKEIQATPDSFPLFANVPRVSDVLAWLSQHPAIAYLDEEGHYQTRLQIENFNYTMTKRPQHGKKQEKYQVKIDLEFSSPIPKWAREFHDALITPNNWVDPKGEVKWSSNRGKYKTTFYLKDKTLYPIL